MAEKKSGVDSLIDALKASGAPVDESTTGKADEKKTEASSSQNTNTANEQASGSMGGLGDIPKAILEMPFMERFKNMKKKGKIITTIVVIVILGIAYWWFHPPINIQSEETWLIFLILFMLPLFLFFRSRRYKFMPADAEKEKRDKKKTEKAKAASSAKAEDEKLSKEILTDENEKKGKMYKRLCWIPLGFAGLGLLGMLLSASFFPGNAFKYADILKTDNLDFETDIQEVNYSQIPVIDRDTARVLGTKEMGSIPDYVSQFEISNLYSQINFRGKPVRVSCLMYADLFKWLTNREAGIPAYCIIDMATQDANIVRISDVDGTEGQGIKYSESEPLARNIERYIQLKYPFEMFDEFSFQVDEEGHPWWICPIKVKTIGLFGGKTIAGVVMCDAVTGECTRMNIEDVPAWTDRVYPSELLLEQYN